MRALGKLSKQAEADVGGILQIGLIAFSAGNHCLGGSSGRTAVTERESNADKEYEAGLFLLIYKEIFYHTSHTPQLITEMAGASWRWSVHDGVLAGQVKNKRAQGQERNEVGDRHEAVQDISDGPDHSQIAHGPDGNCDDP